eukprot:gnl/MRDRNA2_/MRDRNA2_30277_c0_seq1.p1 gnl/MRDRNA2_/MRDRNA2_30277_c0~~gnl/MRDRNA2_/MRDRNA2_30277_c0_seq1.p1  ORF type:complete len:154 (-),score=25.55 gnl/MRDRNA2_/MRDRNA2_30277_c0_seq1:114-575(-)
MSFFDEYLFSIGNLRLTGENLLMLIVLLVVGVLAFQLEKQDTCEDIGKSCTARHILMTKEEDLLKVKERIAGGEDFSKVAIECSTCFSGETGGSLGSFGPDKRGPPFDKVCFDPNTKIGEVIGPIKGNSGYHLIIVDSRKGVDEVDTASKKNE